MILVKENDQILLIDQEHKQTLTDWGGLLLFRSVGTWSYLFCE